MRDLEACPRDPRYPPLDLFVSFRFTGAIFLKKTSDEKLKTFVMYFYTKKSKSLIEKPYFRELSNFGRDIKTKVRENESKMFKGPTILFDLPRYWRYREISC